MNGQILTKLEIVEKELKEIKTLLKKPIQRVKRQPKLTLTEIADKLKVVGKEISPKEVEEIIREVRARE